MKLNELKKGETARVVRIDAPADLKNRLMSFGVIRGAQITISEYAPAKKTLKLAVNATMIALRFEEADHIEVAQ